MIYSKVISIFTVASSCFINTTATQSCGKSERCIMQRFGGCYPSSCETEKDNMFPSEFGNVHITCLTHIDKSLRVLFKGMNYMTDCTRGVLLDKIKNEEAMKNTQ